MEAILGDPTRGGSLALIGPRRCGKTSLLKMLPLKLPDTQVRFLISGATWLDELEPVWADHFVNLRQLSIGHLTQPVVMDLLTRPTADFPPDAIPAELAQAVWGRTLGQPYLTQLCGQMVVERLNREKRQQATAADCAAVEPKLLDQADG